MVTGNTQNYTIHVLLYRFDVNPRNFQGLKLAQLKKGKKVNPLFIAHRDKTYVLVVGGIFIFFYILSLILPSDTPGDSIEYLQMSENIYQNGQFYCGDLSHVIEYDKFTKRPPLYPILIGIFGLWGNAQFLLFFIQNLLIFCGLYLLRNLAFNFSYSSSYDKYLYPAILFLPALWIYPQLVMTESFLFFFMSLIGYSGVKSMLFRDIKWAVISILLCCIAAFVKPVMFPGAVLVGLVGFLYGILKRVELIIAASAITLGIIASYMYFNYQRTGTIIFSSISTINLVDYNSYYFLLERRDKEFAEAKIDVIYKGLSDTMTYGEKLNIRYVGGKSILLKHPISYVYFHLKGMLKFFLFPGRYDVFTFFGVEQSVPMLEVMGEKGYAGAVKYLLSTSSIWLIFLLGMSFLVKIILLIGVGYFLFLKKIPRFYKLIFCGIVLYIAILTGPLGASRFFMPVSGIYLMMAITGIGIFLGNFKRH